jgi:hypothetical protein
MATIEVHEVVNYRGRDVCSCGDFNCASLDTHILLKPNLVGHMRNAIYSAYAPSYTWLARVKTMNDQQVYAVYTRLQSENKL